MKTLMKPRKLAIVETLAGQRVRIISFDSFTGQVKVKSLATGLPFTTTKDQLQLPS